MKSVARIVAAGALGVLLSGCSYEAHWIGASTRVEQSDYTFTAPPHGNVYRCLSADPGTPVYGSNGAGVIGYTRDVVAATAAGRTAFVNIVYYNGLIGTVDASKVRPFHGKHPGSTCSIPAVDQLQRPIFVIN